MLASDVANPEFVGARPDPDAALIAEFYIRPVQNIFQSSKQGRPIFEDIIYIKINVPGLKEMQVDTPARTDHQARFPRQYQHFINKTQGDAKEVGTPLTEWPVMTRSAAEEFRALKFYTVESIANASDSAITNLGMIGGMSPYTLRDKARAFLQAAINTALPQHQASELAKRDAEIAMLKEQMADIVSRIPAKGAAPQPVQVAIPTAPAARKRGRPTNAELAARRAAGASG